MKNAKNKKRWLGIIGFAVAVTGSVCAVNVEHMKKCAGQEKQPAVSDGVEIAAEQEMDELLSRFEFSGMLPSYYSSADCGRKPTVKSQGSYGTCWALAATSALESALLPEKHIIFSADHLALHNAFTVPVNDGGDARMTMAYLSSWQGPVTEKEDPYGDGYSPDGLTPAVHVQEIQLFDGADRQEIKEAVRKYGAVQTSLYMSRETVLPEAGYYNEWTAAYYAPQEETQNHEILILGWDDSFSRFLFAQAPDIDGAFICQNSWGDEFGADGIFYVSYADANIARTAMAYTKIEPTDNYDMIYQTDDCGWRGRQGYDDGECWFANVYRAGKNERLAAAGFYAVGENTSYDLYLVEAPSKAADFSNRRLLKSGTFRRSGYYTVELSEEISLKDGERFALLVHINTPDDVSPVAVEYEGDPDAKHIVLDGKYGFISHDGSEWDHTEKKYGSNVCLKAYTRTMPAKNTPG